MSYDVKKAKMDLNYLVYESNRLLDTDTVYPSTYPKIQGNIDKMTEITKEANIGQLETLKLQLKLNNVKISGLNHDISLLEQFTDLDEDEAADLAKAKADLNNLLRENRKLSKELVALKEQELTQ